MIATVTFFVVCNGVEVVKKERELDEKGKEIW